MPQANKKQTPPKWARKWVQQWIEPDTAEYLLGDLEEFFEDDLEQSGSFRAKWNYSMGAIGLTRLAFLRRKKQSIFYIPTAMYRNYLKIAWRHLVKQKLYSVINIMGLTVGLAVFLLIFLYIRDEMSFNAFHSNKNEIYQVTTKFNNGAHWNVPSFPAGPVLQADFPDIKLAGRMVMSSNVLVSRNGKSISQDNFCIADTQIFDIFDFPFIEGDPKKALEAPYSVVLSEDAAKVYFGNEPAMGQTLQIKEDTTDMAFIVTGILKNIPPQSDIHFDMAVSWKMANQFGIQSDNWGNWGPLTYVLVHPGTVQRELEEKIAHVITEHGEEEKGSNILYLNPLNKVHLYALEEKSVGPIQYVIILGIIGIFILLIACINFMNLTTARSMIRAKEIGLRKVVGAKRKDLIGQFYMESLLMSAIGMALALVAVRIALPYFNELADKEILFQPWQYPMVIYILVITLITGLLAGSYPALLLSSYDPVAVLKGAFKFSNKGKRLRKGLVITQFALSIILILSTLIIQDQMAYIQNKKLGFEKEQVIYVNNISNLRDIYPVMREELLRKPGVIQAASSTSLPTNIGTHCGIPDFDGRDLNEKYPFLFVMVDSGFAETFQFNMAEGEFFSSKFPTGEGKPDRYVLNQTAVRMMGLENPVGKRLSVWGHEGTITGIVEDFHFQSVREEVKPIVIWNRQAWLSFVSVRISPQNVAQTLAEVESVWEKYMPGVPFEYHFVDESFENIYEAEEVMSKLFSAFSFLAIFISCLGLFGLAAFIAEQRKKEIGIRKVLGANISQIFTLLSKDFTFPVIIAFGIATPIALYLMHSWMAEFAYHTTIGVWPVILAGLAALIIAVFTVSYQSIKAAWANPVDSLKDE